MYRGSCRVLWIEEAFSSVLRLRRLKEKLHRLCFARAQAAERRRKRRAQGGLCCGSVGGRMQGCGKLVENRVAVLTSFLPPEETQKTPLTPYSPVPVLRKHFGC